MTEPDDNTRGFAARFGRTSTPCDHCGARAHSFCDVLKGQEFQQLAAIVLSRSFAPRQTIVQEGDPADFLMNVVSGTVKIFRALPDGRTQIIGFLGEGDFMGMPPAQKYAMSAESITPVETCNFPRHSFERLVRESPTLEHRLFDLASNEIAAAHDHMLLLGRKTARERVASFLVQMSSKLQCGHAHEPCLRLAMTRAEIADYLGLTMETVSRTLTAFRRDGLIVIRSPDQVQASQLDQLKRVAAGTDSQ
jgi:CRP/FNR family transcriptional regulator